MRAVLLTDTVTADLDRAVHYTLLWGLDGVALRTVGGAGDRVPHVNEARLRHRLADAELPVAAVDPGLFEAPPAARTAWMNDVAAFADTASFCRRVGCEVVLVGALAAEAEGWDAAAAGAALAQAAAVAAAAGLRLAVRNATGTACATGEALAAVLAAAAHPAAGAAWSPADALESGADPAAGLAALLDAGVPLHYVAVRDGAVADGAWQEALPGEGAVGWPHQLGALAAAGYAGPLGLEVRLRPAATHGLRAGTALLTLVRAAVRRSRAAGA